VDPKSLDLSVMEGGLTIKGEKPGLAQVSAEAYHRNERAAGPFVRTVELPIAVDAGKVSADYRNGLLLVTLPKAESARPRQVPITVR
jgi:HSP20 family protein